MSGIKIDQQEWISFINDFNKKNLDKLVDLKVTNDQKKVIEERKGLPFKGIDVSLTQKDNPILTLVAGASNEATHFIEQANHLIFEKTENDIAKSLIIESSTGRSAAIYFENT